MAKYIPFGQPVNEGERRLLVLLRDKLPDAYTVIGNPEINLGHQIFEVDAVVLAPHAVYLLDAKGTQGDVTVQCGRWYPLGREPFHSPVAKIRSHAKVLKGTIEKRDPARFQELRSVYVEPLVVLTSPGARIASDGPNTDRPNVVGIDGIIARIQDIGQLPPWSKPLAATWRLIEKLLIGAAKQPSPLKFGSWLPAERLSATETFEDFRAKHSTMGAQAGSVRLRVYRLDTLLAGPEKARQQQLITNAYVALNRLPSHSAIIAAKDFFEVEGGEAWVLVSEDIPGSALRMHLDGHAAPLTWDQKLVVAREILDGLAHCHQHQVIHRDLSPAAVLITPNGHAKLTAFDHARPYPNRSGTIAAEIRDLLDPHYLAPECHDDPVRAVAASDVFSAGVMMYEMFAGELPWNNTSEALQLDCRFPRRLNPPVPGLDWLHDLVQSCCQRDPAARPSAADVLSLFSAKSDLGNDAPPVTVAPLNYTDLPAGTMLAGKFRIEERLGKPGGFAVAYKALDTLADAPRVLKLVVKDRTSVADRFLGEYKKLANLPEHPRVMRVLDGAFLPQEGPPYLVFPFLDGFDLDQLIQAQAITPDDGLRMAKEVAEGLVHLHRHKLFHCDIKPRNILWTKQGAVIIDFNVAMFAHETGHGGGQLRYLPPDFDATEEATPSQRADRDVVALAITLYEAITDGGYPWEADHPQSGRDPLDPRTVRTKRGKVNGNARLSQQLVQVLNRALSPFRSQRFPDAESFLNALASIDRALVPETTAALTSVVPAVSATAPTGVAKAIPQGAPSRTGTANTNPFVELLATLYSQSEVSNRGTRGLDADTNALYIETNLDRVLAPAIMARKFRLVVITGNAGDGKTAFLQRLEQDAVQAGGLREPTVNGARITFASPSTPRVAERGASVPVRTAPVKPDYEGVKESATAWNLLTNHDGSQDAGTVTNDVVLSEFFAPFKGATAATWPDGETRLIAINEGRLQDFLEHPGNGDAFSHLTRLLQRGFNQDEPQDGVVVVNLTRRAVVAADTNDESIVTRLLDGFTTPAHWSACQSCDLKDRCFARHNAITLRAPVAGAQVRSRIQQLYTLVHLKNDLHITLRDARSALAFTLTSGKTCDQIHDLYATDAPGQVLAGFYYNAAFGGNDPGSVVGGSRDRLLTSLRSLDPALADDPGLDRRLDSQSAEDDDRERMTFADRGAYDGALLASAQAHMATTAGEATPARIAAHQRVVGWQRRRWFFERRDDGWQDMLPYRSARELIGIVTGSVTFDPKQIAARLVMAINRGEGLTDPARLGNDLVLRVRPMDKARLKSFRTFPAVDFTVELDGSLRLDGLVESMPTGLLLVRATTRGARLRIGLDLFELLTRLVEGYWPSVEQRQGRLHELAVFKNLLSAEPYQRIILTEDGHRFHAIARDQTGTLTLSSVGSDGDRNHA